MERRSKTINFSLPPALYGELDKLASASQRSRSELLRDLISGFLTQNQAVPDGKEFRGEMSLPDILKAFWNARTSWPLDVIITGLAIAVNDIGEVLIGRRRGEDGHVPNLSWSFPGSQLHSVHFQTELVNTLHQRTGLNIELSRVVAARVIPESGVDGVQVVAMYSSGSVQGKQNFVAHEPYTELKWVKPLEVFKYFTSSTTDEVTAFLAKLNSGLQPK